MVSTTIASGATMSGETERGTIDLVARRKRGRDGRQFLWSPSVRGVGRAPPGALLRRRIQVNLHVGVGEHHGADVPSLYDHAVPASQRALAIDEHLAHLRHPRHRRRRLVDVRRPHSTRNVGAVRHHETVFDGELQSGRQRAHGIFVGQRQPSPERSPTHRAIHRARVHVCVVERARQRARHRALPHA